MMTGSILKTGKFNVAIQTAITCSLSANLGSLTLRYAQYLLNRGDPFHHLDPAILPDTR